MPAESNKQFSLHRKFLKAVTENNIKAVQALVNIDENPENSPSQRTCQWAFQEAAHNDDTEIAAILLVYLLVKDIVLERNHISNFDVIAHAALEQAIEKKDHKIEELLRHKVFKDKIDLPLPSASRCCVMQ